MTGKELLNRVANGETDFLQVSLDVLEETAARHCVIGGLAVNAYAEPVVSLDIGLVVATGRLEHVGRAAAERGIEVERHPHSVNLSAPGSDLRVQLQTDPRYQEFLRRAEERTVLGYPLRVARVEDVLQGKLWAYQDDSRRPSKRQKDLADIARLVEAHPELAERLPHSVWQRLA